MRNLVESLAVVYLLSPAQAERHCGYFIDFLRSSWLSCAFMLLLQAGSVPDLLVLAIPVHLTIGAMLGVCTGHLYLQQPVSGPYSFGRCPAVYASGCNTRRSTYSTRFAVVLLSHCMPRLIRTSLNFNMFNWLKLFTCPRPSCLHSVIPMDQGKSIARSSGPAWSSHDEP